MSSPNSENQDNPNSKSSLNTSKFIDEDIYDENSLQSDNDDNDASSNNRDKPPQQQQQQEEEEEEEED